MNGGDCSLSFVSYVIVPVHCPCAVKTYHSVAIDKSFYLAGLIPVQEKNTIGDVK